MRIRPPLATASASSTSVNWLIALRLGIKDLWHDWRVSAALTLSIVTVLAPLLLLFGLKKGVVGTLRELMLEDPRHLEIVIFGNTRLPREWFTALETHRDVRFVIPKTRTINTLLDLEYQGHHLSGAEMIPTGQGDPLLPAVVTLPWAARTVLLTQAAATQLGVAKDAQLTGILRRTVGGRIQMATLNLKITGIVPERFFARPAVFVTLSLLEGVEDFMDGYSAPALGLTEGKPRSEPRTSYASARLYARTLEAVGSLSDRLRREGLEIRTRAEEIGRLQAADYLLTQALGLIALISVMGGSLAFCGAIWISVEHKRISLALLRLIGFSGPDIALFTLFQALILGIIAFILAYLLFLLGAEVFNRYGVDIFFQLIGATGTQADICRLQTRDLAAAALLTLIFAGATALVGALHAKSIEPGECLRQA